MYLANNQAHYKVSLANNQAHYKVSLANNHAHRSITIERKLRSLLVRVSMVKQRL